MGNVGVLIEELRPAVIKQAVLQNHGRIIPGRGIRPDLSALKIDCGIIRCTQVNGLTFAGAVGNPHAGIVGDHHLRENNIVGQHPRILIGIDLPPFNRGIDQPQLTIRYGSEGMIGVELTVFKFSGDLVVIVTGQPNHRHLEIRVPYGDIAARVWIDSQGHTV